MTRPSTAFDRSGNGIAVWSAFSANPGGESGVSTLVLQRIAN